MLMEKSRTKVGASLFLAKMSRKFLKRGLRVKMVDFESLPKSIRRNILGECPRCGLDLHRDKAGARNLAKGKAHAGRN
jgi:hypothetical protein